MIPKEISDDIKEIRTPGIRLTIIFLVIAVIFLGSFFINSLSSDKGNTKELKQKVESLEKKVDTINFMCQQREGLWQKRLQDADNKYDNVQALRYEESQSRINDFKSLLKIANSVKSKVKKLK